MRKAPRLHEDLKKSQNKLSEFDLQRNKLFHFPFLNKKEWLHVPVVGKEIISIPQIENFEVSKQDNKDSCGLCVGKMVINNILKNSWKETQISENSIIKKSPISKLWLMKKYVGITPWQLQKVIQEILDKHHLPYTALEKHFITYTEIKNLLEKWSYIIFSYMWDSIDNPYRTKNGKKDMSLEGIHHPHYFILLEIDERKEIVTVANPFGYIQKIFFKEFWQRISLHPKYLHSSKLYLPLVESGLYMPRTCVIVAKK